IFFGKNQGGLVHRPGKRDERPTPDLIRERYIRRETADREAPWKQKEVERRHSPHPPYRLNARSASRTARIKRRSLSWSLRPGSHSTPDDTSTMYGRTAATASATFSGVSPPARMTGSPRC